MTVDEALRGGRGNGAGNGWGLPVLHGLTRPDRIPVRRYYDPEFYQLELELLWPRVWQMACRLEEIPEPGDFVEYENVGRSVVLVRQPDGGVRAYNNACRHRGVKLVQDRGSLPAGFTCPFHGWCWGIDGENTFLYQPDLFSKENRDPADIALQEVRVELWGDGAFINFDPDAPSLRESIEPFATALDAWHADSLRTEWWMAARLPVNWKLAMEAFMEGYHVMETHTQLLPPGARGRNAVYKTAEGRPTLQAQLRQGKTMSSREYIDDQIHYMRVFGEGMDGMTHRKDLWIADQLRNLELPEDPVERVKVWRYQLNQAIVDRNRAAGIDVPDLNRLDAEGFTTQVNFCFPHFFLLPSFSSGASYRIRPLGPEECLFELWSLTRYAPGEEPPRPQRPEPLAGDDPAWPHIPHQDFSNLPRQQQGLHTAGFEYMRLSNQVEGLIGNYQRLIDGYLAGVGHDRLVTAVQQINGGIDRPVADLGL